MKRIVPFFLAACAQQEAASAPIVVTMPAPTPERRVEVKPPPPPPKPRAFDLDAAPRIPLKSAPANASVSKPIGAMPAKARTLREVSRTADTSAEARARSDLPYDPKRHSSFEGHAGTLPEGAPAGIPLDYAGKKVLYLSSSGGRLLVGYGTIYGSRYIAVIAGDKVEGVIDFYPPELGLEPEETASADVHDVIWDDGVLYACRGYNSHPRSRKGYVTAIDAATGEFRWRSVAQTCGGALVLFGDYVVTGYGEDVMPYQARLLRRHDGVLVQSFHNDGASLEYDVEGEKLIVGTYKHRIVYELR